MKAVIQKSGRAFVKIENNIVGEINNGIVILLGITNSDSENDIDYLVDKIINLRIFEKDDKYFEESLLQTSKQALVISQFTLYASCKKGRRPDFSNAAKRDVAEPLYEKFIEKLKENEIDVQTGEFGAMMDVTLTNIGPVTIILDSSEK